MSTKLRIKLGIVEVEYEGSDEFLRKELPELLKAVLELRSSAGEIGAAAPEETQLPPSSNGTTNSKLSTSTIAAKTGSKSGSDLALAAAAAMVLGEGKESFSRAQLLKSMQAAKAYYKATYSKNLSTYISTLVKSQDLLDHGGDSYGLHDTKRKDLEKTLA